MTYFSSGVPAPGPRRLTRISTNPIFLALSAFTVLPVRAMSNVFGTEISFCNRWVPPAPGRRPTITSGTPRPVLESLTAIL